MFDPWVGKDPLEKDPEENFMDRGTWRATQSMGSQKSDTTEVTKQQPEETPSPLLSGHQLSGHGRQSVVAPGESEVIPL